MNPNHPPLSTVSRLTLYLANVTSWNDAASASLRAVNVLAMAEHHRQGKPVTQLMKQLEKMGWKVSAEPAAETGTAVVRKCPGHGGVWVGVRSHHHQRGLSATLKQAVKHTEICPPSGRHGLYEHLGTT